MNEMTINTFWFVLLMTGFSLLVVEKNEPITLTTRPPGKGE